MQLPVINILWLTWQNSSKPVSLFKFFINYHVLIQNFHLVLSYSTSDAFSHQNFMLCAQSLHNMTYQRNGSLPDEFFMVMNFNISHIQLETLITNETLHIFIWYICHILRGKCLKSEQHLQNFKAKISINCTCNTEQSSD